MIVMTKIPYEQLKKVAYPGVIISVVLLLLLFIPHVGIQKRRRNPLAQYGRVFVSGDRTG